MTQPVLPPPRTVAVELVGGPLCGSPTTAPLGPDSRPPPAIATERGGCYLRTDRMVPASSAGGHRSAGYRTAYTWQAG